MPLTKSLNSSVIPKVSRSFPCVSTAGSIRDGATPSAKCLILSACFKASNLIWSALLEASAAISLERLAVSETMSDNLEAPTVSSWDRLAASLVSSCERFAASSAKLRAFCHKSMDGLGSCYLSKT